TISNLAAAGIKTTLYVVIGHPGETEQDFQLTLDLVSRLKDDIWEAECNPFTYFYSGQAGAQQWVEKSELLYPTWAKEMLITQTWIINAQPSREEMYRRIYRFVDHCKRLGISTPWSLNDVNKSDERWKRLHKDAVPSVLELIKQKNDANRGAVNVNHLTMAQDTHPDDEEFDF
ncbi:MAG: hypothetical protein MUF15_15390, partial [Acidobacteria bacterium]|nr:hypothetical protein [Acidobacteriota bacterium]